MMWILVSKVMLPPWPTFGPPWPQSLCLLIWTTLLPLGLCSCLASSTALHLMASPHSNPCSHHSGSDLKLINADLWVQINFLLIAKLPRALWSLTQEVPLLGYKHQKGSNCSIFKNFLLSFFKSPIVFPVPSMEGGSNRKNLINTCRKQPQLISKQLQMK